VIGLPSNPSQQGLHGQIDRYQGVFRPGGRIGLHPSEIRGTARRLTRRNKPTQNAPPRLPAVVPPLAARVRASPSLDRR